MSKHCFIVYSQQNLIYRDWVTNTKTANPHVDTLKQ